MLPALADLIRTPAPTDVASANVPTEANSFPPQWGFVTSEAKFKLVFCGRRAGKTAGIRLRTVRRALMRPGHKKLYVTLIRRNCRKLFWRPILNELQDRGVEFEANEVDMICRLANGSIIEATGCDDIRSAGKMRGDDYDDVDVDEAQEPNDDVLEPLVEEVLFPTLIDRGGELTLAGTPPDAMVGYFIERLSDPRWQRFGWSMFDNPYIPRKFIDEMIAAKGLTPEHPIYRREILGLPEVDPDKLVYEYQRKRNDFDASLLDQHGETWRYAMGLDLGFQDSDAIVVVGWRKDDPERRLYVVYQWHANHLDVDVLAEKTRQVYEQYRPVSLVGDHGGHAAQKILATISARLNVLIQPKPSDVNVSIGLVNDDLRNSRLLIEAHTGLVKDLGLVTWHIEPGTGKRVANKRGFHSDLADALRYAHHGARHFKAKAPKPEPTRDERRERWEREKARREADPWR